MKYEKQWSVAYTHPIQELKLLGYGCSDYDEFHVDAEIPFFRAIAKHGEHNKEKHPKGPPPTITYIYRS